MRQKRIWKKFSISGSHIFVHSRILTKVFQVKHLTSLYCGSTPVSQEIYNIISFPLRLNFTVFYIFFLSLRQTAVHTMLTLTYWNFIGHTHLHVNRRDGNKMCRSCVRWGKAVGGCATWENCYFDEINDSLHVNKGDGIL